ncbi:MAG: putative Ig domain-containing protein [Planctomycetes bacterium]|nr:putative Ig domain-containing protein [Planctomycetota bacterium]
MKTALLSFSLVVCAGSALAATDVRVNFVLNTTDENGVPITENRYYYVYRPDGLSKSTPVPMILLMEHGPGCALWTASLFHRKADQAGFLVVGCSFSGNYTGTPGTVWNNDDPRITGWEDMDYTTAVIQRVRAAENGSDAFICGLSKGGHMAYAYACVRPDMLKAACSVDEFMGLTSNIPAAPLPIIAFHGTADTNVSYTMQRDSVDAWRMIDGLLGAAPVTTYESSPLRPGQVTQATWRGGVNGTQVAFVTITGGGHNYAQPSAGTGYDSTDGMWAFFSQFLTSTQAAPKIVAQPVDNIQLSGPPASFWVAATGNPPLVYQWQRNGVDLPGATSNWYTTPATTLADNGAMFRALVRDEAGSATSTGATLTVNVTPGDPKITTQPLDQTVVAGQPVTFTVTATGTAPLSCRWKKNGMNLVGAASDTLTIPVALTSDCGATFTATVTSRSSSVTSVPATLTVNPAPGAPILLANVVRARVLTGQTATFSVRAWSLTPMSYQWQTGPFTGNMVDIPGATAATYTTGPTTLADHPPLFRCVVSNPAGSTVSASEMLMVTTDVKQPTDITSFITVSTQVGLPFTYTITSSGGTTPVMFSASPLPAGLSLNAATGVISGTPTATGTAKILLTARNSAGSTSATLTLTVTPNPPVVPIEAWRALHFGASQTNAEIAGDSADPDGDGVSNLQEYANGTDPLSSVSTDGLPALPDNDPPSVPTQLAAKNATSGRVTLVWNASTDNVGVVFYGVYRNGVEVPYATQTPGMGTVQDDSVYPFVIGVRGNAAQWPNTLFNGVLDDIRLYNRPLTSQEIRDLYSSAAVP